MRGFRRSFDLCHALGHRRSRRWVRPIAGQWASVCCRCGTELIRVARGTWRELRETRFRYDNWLAARPIKGTD